MHTKKMGMPKNKATTTPDDMRRAAQTLLAVAADIYDHNHEHMTPEEAVMQVVVHYAEGHTDRFCGMKVDEP